MMTHFLTLSRSTGCGSKVKRRQALARYTEGYEQEAKARDDLNPGAFDEEALFRGRWIIVNLDSLSFSLHTI